MQTKTQTHKCERRVVKPMGDDWLTRDPESFAEFDQCDSEVETPPRSARWRRLRDDLLLYGAGMTTGLTVVAIAWLLMQLAATPAAGLAPVVDGDAASVVERVARS